MKAISARTNEPASLRWKTYTQKYAVTAKAIEAKRDTEAAKLKTFLVELGYE